MQRIPAALIAVGLLVGVGVLWLRGDGAQRSAAPAATVAAPSSAGPAPVASAGPAPVAAAPAPAPTPETGNLMYRKPSPEARETLERMEEVQQAAAEWDRRKLAAARFSEAVESSRLEARHIHRSVRSMFESVELEPVLDDEAMILGLRIDDILPGSPLGAAGFQVGDRITRINETRLHDPADVPDLLTRLERDLTVCADREGIERCARLSLD